MGAWNQHHQRNQSSLKQSVSGQRVVLEELEPRLLLSGTIANELVSIKAYSTVAEQSAPRHLTPVTLGNEFINITVDEAGAFTMQRSADDKWLLYPSAGTSAFSVKVDDNIYWTESLENFGQVNGPVVDSDTSAHIEYVTPEQVRIIHEFDLAGQAVRFRATVINDSGSAHDVGIRYLFDTQIDENDGSPLYAPGVTDSQGSTVCTYEVDIPNVFFQEWQGYDIWPNPNLVGVGTLATVPDRMVFAWWPEAHNYAWDYTPDPNQRFYTPGYTSSPNSDSCVLMYFEMGEIGPGQQDEAITYYGIGEPDEGTGIDQVVQEMKRLGEEAKASVNQAFWQFASDFGDSMVALRTDGWDSLRQGLGMITAITGVLSGQVNPHAGDAVTELAHLAHISTDAAQMICDLSDIYSLGTSVVGAGGVRFDPGTFTQELEAWFSEENDEQVLDIDGDGDTDNTDFILDTSHSSADIRDELLSDIHTNFESFFLEDGTPLSEPGIYGLNSYIEDQTSEYITYLQQENPSDYPAESVLGYLSNLRSGLRSSRSREVFMPPINDESDHRPYILGGYHSQSGLIADQIGRMDLNERVDWGLTIGNLGLAGASVAKALGAIVTGGTSLAAELIIGFGLSTASLINRYYHMKAGEALQASVNQEFVSVGLEAESIADVVFGCIDYLRAVSYTHLTLPTKA